MVERIKNISWWKRLIIIFSLLGPGIITGSVDNDAGGITTYSLAGAVYGYNMIWTLLPAFLALIVVQEMNARMGIVTGKGLADLIRENAGVKVTFFIFLGMLLIDVGNTTSEFAGIAGSMEVFGVNKYISVPIVGFLVWFMVVKGTYSGIEKIFLVFSASLLVYIVSAIMGKPDWQAIGHATIHPKIEFTLPYISMVVGLVGTTIAPWMQFYMQSSVIEKKLKVEDYKITMIDVVVGSIATVVVAFFIMVACASTLNLNGIEIHTAKDAALALKPLAGDMAQYVFAFGLFVASVFAASILPLTTSFYICQAFGFEAGVDKKWHEAPQFYTLYTSMIIIGVTIILIPNVPLIILTYYSQIMNGLLLPIVLISMFILINKPEVMGKYVNTKFKNIISGTTIFILICLSILLLVFLII
jgi:Mn2+/Fe2+ NRAMP family transporter